MKRALTLLALACIVLVPATVATAATPITGTVTVENGTADGAQVTIAPVTENLQRADDPVRTTVNGSSFSADVPDAPAYVVRIVHEGNAHYQVLKNGTSADIALDGTLSGQVVDGDGDARTNATVRLTDEDGFVVGSAQTDANGEFSFVPVESNETYQLDAEIDGVPYRRTVNAGEANRSVTVSTPPPVDDESVLAIEGGNPASHVVQVLAPQNETGNPSVVETLTVRNTGDRPYVGTVNVTIPADGTVYSAMTRNQEASYQQTPDGVSLNVSVAANETVQVGVAYDLPGQTFEKQLGRDTESVAVVFQGYDPQQVNHSENLRVGDAPIPLLTTNGSVDAGETIRVNVTGARAQTGTGSNASAGAEDMAASGNNSIPTFPAVELFGGLAAIVGVGLAAYRLL